MLTTAELRWFARGSLPAEIEHWFEQDQLGDHLAPAEEREDVYLYLPGCDYLGIKMRQGRLEIKWRKAELGVVGFEDRVEGKAEKWVKWTYRGAKLQQPDSFAYPSWLSVVV